MKLYCTRWLLLCFLAQAVNAQAGNTLKVMTFNAWGGGLNDGTTTEQTTAAIRAAGADVIGMQETRAESAVCAGDDCRPQGASVAPEIAKSLGFYYFEQSANNEALWANAILSRYPILGPTPLGLGVRIDVKGRVVYLFNIHLTDYPYQPFQVLGIPYDAAPYISTSAEAVRSAQQARGGALKLLQQDLAVAERADLSLVTGDFNEPSFRDWTEAAVAAGQQPMAVSWPSTSALEAEGFSDAFRAVHPDEVAVPGFTWSPLITTDTTNDHRDRIDFIFFRGKNARAEQAMVVGENETTADIVVSPWPSDHRAVVSIIDF